MQGFNGLGMHLGNLARLSDAETRSISAENPTGDKGKGAMAEADPNGPGMVLLRLVTRNLLATRVEDPEPEVLCRGVRSFDLMYHDGTDWQEDWDSAEHDNTLPRAVLITLELLPEDGEQAGVSRHHARMLYGPDGWMLEDLDSTNGTFLNGKQVMPGLRVRVHAGDVVRFGMLTLIFYE